MFDINDLYSVSSGLTVFNYWNPFVTKHDTSSFYNWEQDNLPLYDLEERTQLLWERFGYPLSGAPGMALIVSSNTCGPLGVEDTHCSTEAYSYDPARGATPNKFLSLSAAIEALPEIIRMPTLIEVAVSGDLGELNLNNIKCEDDGVLEIVNRGFAPLIQNDFSSVVVQADDEAFGHMYLPQTLGASGAIYHLLSSSAISTETCVSSLFNWETSVGHTRKFVLPARGVSGAGGYNSPGYCYPGISDNNVQWVQDIPYRLAANPISVIAGKPVYSIQTDATMASLDLSTINLGTGNDLAGAQYQDNQVVNGIITANWLTKVEAQNCDGPIYIRGFVVDGGNSFTTGFGIQNCTNLTIENCGSMRCTQAGFDIKNSSVNLRRQAFAARNYDVADRGTLTTYGFKLVNSDVNFVTDSYNSGVAAKLASHFHDYGIHMENSVLRGGDKISNTEQLDVFSTDLGFNNTNLYLSNSKYTMDGILNTYNGVDNIKALDSVIETEQTRSSYAKKNGLLMNNSKFTYNKNYSSSAIGLDTAKQQSGNGIVSNNFPILFDRNGQHIVMGGGSTYGPTYGSGMDITTLYNMELYNEHHAMFDSFGQGNAVDASKPGVVVNNSTAEFTAAKFLCSDSKATPFKSSPVALSVINGGKATVRGLTYTTLNGASVFAGANKRKAAAVVADGGSTINFTGPVGIYGFGLGAAATNRSTLSIAPPLDGTDSVIDIRSENDFATLSGWGGGANKATPLMEVHSMKAGLVADNNSNLIIKDLGYVDNMWPTASLTDDRVMTPQYIDLIMSGGLQFYPNKADRNAANMIIDHGGWPTTGNRWNRCEEETVYNAMLAADASLSCYRLLYNADYSTDTETFFRGVSLGGECVRATNNSSVKVMNVHFPMGFANMDGSFYDASTSPAGCNNLMIWNIADSSQLHASHCAVSGTHPVLAGYTGPKAVYFKEGDVYGLSAASSLPPGTPDTGIISVLDHFGSGVSFSSLDMGNSGVSSFMSDIQKARTGITTMQTYGESEYQNRGPFRLYFSVSPAAKKLFYCSAVDVGHIPRVSDSYDDNRPYQHLSQGYLLSGTCSALTTMSSMYPNLLNERSHAENGGVLVTSGYYYPDSMAATTKPSVWLSESAASIFANARHCSTDYSNRIKYVNIYDSDVNVHSQGEITTGFTEGYGLGFRTSNIFDLERDT